MLRLVHTAQAKKVAQLRLRQIVIDSAASQGIMNVGFRGGNVNREVFSLGKGELWASISPTPIDSDIPKYWNAFGILADRPVQHIVVEVNIPTPSNSWLIAGAFAEDEQTGDIYLMHDGAIGGGRKGIGKKSFLLWSKIGMVEVMCEDGRVREAIPIGNLDSKDFFGRLSHFAAKVEAFKEAVRNGELSGNAFKKIVEENDRYNKEFSGKKRGSRRATFAYETYHGDIVDAVVTQRKAVCLPGEEVFNTQLIDCYVKRAGRMTEIYEIKTGIGRQQLYTAIGQLMTHAASIDVVKILVVPTADDLPVGFAKAVAALNIEVRGFKLSGSKRKRVIELVAP